MGFLTATFAESSVANSFFFLVMVPCTGKTRSRRKTLRLQVFTLATSICTIIRGCWLVVCVFYDFHSGFLFFPLSCLFILRTTINRNVLGLLILLIPVGKRYVVDGISDIEYGCIQLCVFFFDNSPREYHIEQWCRIISVLYDKLGLRYSCIQPCIKNYCGYLWWEREYTHIWVYNLTCETVYQGSNYWDYIKNKNWRDLPRKKPETYHRDSGPPESKQNEIHIVGEKFEGD